MEARMDMDTTSGSTQSSEQEEKEKEGRRRDVRHKYRQVNEKLEENRSRLTNPEHEGLIAHLQSINKEIPNIVHPREFAIDTSTVRKLAEMGVQQVEQIRIDTFDKEKFMEKLFTEMGGHRRSSLDWSKLGHKMLPAFECSPRIEFISSTSGEAVAGIQTPLPIIRQRCLYPLQQRYGSLTLTPRVKMSRKMSRQDRPLATETTRPVEVQQSGDGEEATTKDVHNLFKHLKAALDKNPQRRVHYFKFLVHPTSFSQTVENIFHFSFLIKDGRAAVELVEEQPYIFFPKHVDPKSKQSTKTGRKQAILSIDMALWKKIVDFYQIKQPQVIPIEH